MFLNTWGGLKVEGRIIRDVRGFVKFPFSADTTADVKERTAAAMAVSLILRMKGRPALDSKVLKEKKSKWATTRLTC